MIFSNNFINYELAQKDKEIEELQRIITNQLPYVESRPEIYISYLNDACYKGNLEVVKYLIENEGIDKNKLMVQIHLFILQKGSLILSNIAKM